MRTRALVAARSWVVIFYLVAVAVVCLQATIRDSGPFPARPRAVRAPVGRGLTGSAQARCARWSTLQSVGVSSGASGADPAFKGSDGKRWARLSCKSVPGVDPSLVCLLVNVGQTGVPGIFFYYFFAGIAGPLFLSRTWWRPPRWWGLLFVVSMAQGSFTQKVAPLPQAVIFPRRGQQWSALLGGCSHRLSRAHAFSQPPAQEARK